MQRTTATASESISSMVWHDLTSDTTLRLPFRARHVVAVSSPNEVEAQLDPVGDAKRFVLAGGSNLVVLEPDFDGAVIRPAVSHWEVERSGSDITLTVGAGMEWHPLVQATLDRGWFGLENLALIPGWVGAAPVQNIGAYGVELSDVCTAITVWDFDEQRQAVLPADRLEFAYRESILKKNRERYLVLAVTLRLSTKPEPRVDYGSIADELNRQGLSAQDPRHVAEAVIAIRTRKLPDPAELANVGSFFKNPVVSAELADTLLADHPRCPIFPFDRPGYRKLAAGWLIDRAGWKGRAIGDFAVHENHALVVVNRGQGTASELRALVGAIREDIGARFSVELEIEPTVIGRFD